MDRPWREGPTFRVCEPIEGTQTAKKRLNADDEQANDVRIRGGQLLRSLEHQPDLPVIDCVPLHDNRRPKKK
jgi:hypothetical protein